MILDTGVLISVDRRDRPSSSILEVADDDQVALHTSEAVVAQVWRDGGRQVHLARFLRDVEVHPLDDGRAVGNLLRRTGTDDVVDAHVALLGKRFGQVILTGDVTGLARLAAAMDHGPHVAPWPPRRASG